MYTAAVSYRTVGKPHLKAVILRNMSKATSMRFPADVLMPMERIAKESGRKVSAVAMELLRESLELRKNGGSARAVIGGGMPLLTIEGQQQPAADGRYKRCEHGRNLHLCMMMKCRRETGRC